MMKAAGRLFLLCSVVLAPQSLEVASAQNKTDAGGVDGKKLEQRCNPKMIRETKLDDKAVHIRKGEKSTGYTPLVTFQISESGDVVNVHLKRSSGIRDYDDAALNRVKSMKYNSRPGCPLIDNHMDVIIDFQ